MNVVMKGGGVVFLAMCMAAVAFGDVPSGKLRIDRTKFLIYAYDNINYKSRKPRTEQYIREMKEGGLDFVFGPATREELDLFHKYGIGVVLDEYLPWWWGGYVDEKGNTPSGRMAELRKLSLYDEAAKKYVDHPAVWAMNVGDEPSALDFEHCAKIVAHTVSNYPCHAAYVNLYPNYASAASLSLEQAKSQLGTSTYSEYLTKYCRLFPLDYICFDAYCWGWGNTPPVLVENLREVSAAATGARKDLWVILQLSTHVEGVINNRKMSVETVRWQAMTALAFGARAIGWFSWLWHNSWVLNAYDASWRKTPAYDMAKQVNVELHRIGEHYEKYRTTHTELVGTTGEYWKKVRQQAVKEAGDSCFSCIHAEDGAALAVGHMLAVDGSGRPAVFIAACDDPEGLKLVDHRIVFRTLSGSVRAWGGSGEVPVMKLADGSFVVPLRTSDGLLIEGAE